MDPFTLLAVAKGAVAAIKQGCELYNEFKGHLIEAKDAIDEARGIATEVSGFWGALKRWLGGPPAGEARAVPAAPRPRATKQLQEFDEAEVKRDIAANLIQFFKALEQLKAHIREEEEKSVNVYDPDQNLMESALNRVLALDQMEALQYEIRQVMVYQTPGMGDLYTRVIRMVGQIQEEQEVARLQKQQVEREERWRRKRAADKLVDAVLIFSVAVLAAGVVGMMWWTLVQDRTMRYGW